MDGSKLISFLGHSSIYPKLDDYLLECGIKKRPKKIESIQWVEDKKLGVKLTFMLSDTFDSETLVPKKSEGNFILSTVQFLNGYADALPYGLTWDGSLQDIEAMFGTALRKRNIDGVVATFFHDNRVVGGYWKKDKLEIVTVALPADHHVDQLGIEVVPE